MALGGVILADSSVWIAHLRAADPQLLSLMERGLLVAHPFVIGEVMLGSVADRPGLRRRFRFLQSARLIRNEIVEFLVEDRRLFSRGIGFIDAHLVASALAGNFRLWTTDKALGRVASELSILHNADAV